MPSPSLALLLSIVLGSAAKIVSREPRTGHAANDTARFPTLALLLSLVRGSSADSADVDIQRTQRGVQNDDKRRLVRLSDVFRRFSPSRETRKWPPI